MLYMSQFFQKCYICHNFSKMLYMSQFFFLKKMWHISHFFEKMIIITFFDEFVMNNIFFCQRFLCYSVFRKKMLLLKCVIKKHFPMPIIVERFRIYYINIIFDYRALKILWNVLLRNLLFGRNYFHRENLTRK